MGHFAYAKIINEFQDCWMLDGGNLFTQNWLAQFNALNDDQRDELAKFDTFSKYFDLFNINAVLSPRKETFIVDKGAVALATYNKYADQVREITNGADQIRFTLQSQHLQNLKYDVMYKTKCVDDEIIHTWRLRANYDYLLNPLPCGTTEQTGILGYICGENPNP